MKITVVLLCLTLYGVAAKDLYDRPMPTSIIKGGHKVNIEKHPYIVAILDTADNFYGGGALITCQWVITAVYNVYYQDISSLRIRLGSNNGLCGGLVTKLENVTAHPGYTGSWLNNLALVKLACPIKSTPKIQPITVGSMLPSAGTKTVISGYGNTVPGVKTDYSLQEAVVSFMPYCSCVKYYEHVTELGFTKRNFCACKSNVGPSPFDWGNPLIYKDQLIGIFAGAPFGCGSEKYPAVYTDLTQFREWIKRTIKCVNYKTR